MLQRDIDQVPTRNTATFYPVSPPGALIAGAQNTNNASSLSNNVHGSQIVPNHIHHSNSNNNDSFQASSSGSLSWSVFTPTKQGTNLQQHKLSVLSSHRVTAKPLQPPTTANAALFDGGCSSTSSDLIPTTVGTTRATKAQKTSALVFTEEDQKGPATKQWREDFKAEKPDRRVEVLDELGGKEQLALLSAQFLGRQREEQQMAGGIAALPTVFDLLPSMGKQPPSSSKNPQPPPPPPPHTPSSSTPNTATPSSLAATTRCRTRLEEAVTTMTSSPRTPKDSNRKSEPEENGKSEKEEEHRETERRFAPTAAATATTTPSATTTASFAALAPVPMKEAEKEHEENDVIEKAKDEYPCQQQPHMMPPSPPRSSTAVKDNSQPREKRLLLHLQRLGFSTTSNDSRMITQRWRKLHDEQQSLFVTRLAGKQQQQQEQSEQRIRSRFNHSSPLSCETTSSSCLSPPSSPLSEETPAGHSGMRKKSPLDSSSSSSSTDTDGADTRCSSDNKTNNSERVFVALQHQQQPPAACPSGHPPRGITTASSSPRQRSFSASVGCGTPGFAEALSKSLGGSFYERYFTLAAQRRQQQEQQQQQQQQQQSTTSHVNQ